MNKLAERPTETIAGLALAAAIYGFLTQAGVPNGIAAVIAVALAFVPAAVTGVVDQIRASKR